MPAQWVLSAWAHRRELQEHLQEVEAKVGSLRESLDEAQVDVHPALLSSEAERTALEDAEATRERLHQQLSSLQPVFDPEIVAALPVEMLQAIFRALAFDHDPLWPVVHEGRYNPTRAGAPWRLAGVCRKWRSVAFGTPEIWSYIASSTVSPNDPTPEIGETLVARMKLLLDRSTTCALDILLVCNDDDCRLSKLDWFRQALNAISQCASRWRRVHLALPTDTRESDLSFLRQPTPLLEEISVSVCDHDVLWKDGSPAYLPSCPSLRTLWMPAVFVPPQSPLRLLTCAHLVVSDSDECRDRLWEALCHMNLLDRLSIEFCWTTQGTPTLTPTPHLRLCRLQSLELSGFPEMVETWVHALEMPLLSKLVLDIHKTTMIERIATFLSAACASVIDLHIIGAHDADGRTLAIDRWPSAIREFPLERVTFSGCDISWRILDELNRPAARPVWPRLQSLTLDRCNHGYFTLTLISFVGFRVPSRHYNNGGHAPLTLAITGIDVERLHKDSYLRSYLRVLEYVLGPQSSRFTDSTGKAALADADADLDREESESDAVLTESDGSEGEGSESSEEADNEGSDWDQTDESNEPERLLVASGPDWDSDQSDDGDYLPSDESDAGSDDE